jgi:hypothetical protein
MGSIVDQVRHGSRFTRRLTEAGRTALYANSVQPSWVPASSEPPDADGCAADERDRGSAGAPFSLRLYSEALRFRMTHFTRIAGIDRERLATSPQALFARWLSVCLRRF